MPTEINDIIAKWGACIVLGLPGAFFLAVTYGALIISKKEGRFVSGCPCIGGICIFLAFLFSPVKWLAVLCVLDYGIWMLPYLFIRDVIKNKNGVTDKANSDNDNKNGK